MACLLFGMSAIGRFHCSHFKDKVKNANPAKTCVGKILRTRKKFYVHKIATVILTKIYLLEDSKKTCKPNDNTHKIKCSVECKLSVHPISAVFLKTSVSINLEPSFK